MRSTIFLICLIFQCARLFGQTIIKGTVYNSNNQVLRGANVFIKGTFDGSTSDEQGKFLFTTDSVGIKTMVVSFLGYMTYEAPVNLSQKAIELSVILSEYDLELNDVVIQAGQFEAGDKKKSVVLNRLDMSTSPTGFGDALGALNTLPGISNTGNEGGLMVRGGERYETKTFIDGLFVESPYTAKLPNVPVRGRFSPMLFKETVFSSGGYSAEFGQALSAALILNSIDFFKKNEMHVSVHLAGLYFAKINTWKNTSFSYSAQYNNMQPFYNIIKSSIVWEKAPRSINQTIVFRERIRENGILKIMCNYSNDKSSMYYNNLDSLQEDLVALKNNDYIVVSSYIDDLGKDWVVHSGISYNYDNEKNGINNYKLTGIKHSGDFKLKLTKTINNRIYIKFGGNICLKKISRDYTASFIDTVYNWKFKNRLSALFAEPELKIAARIAVRLGVRYEIHSLSNESYLLPRISAAYKTSASSQFSLAFGLFSQQPGDEYVLYNPNLNSEKAEHYILNYQYTKNNRIFRIEGYYKKYSGLIKYDSLHATSSKAYNNNGHGYANGIDIFYRDNKSVRNAIFWISYAFMDSKRNYKDYEFVHTPGFISRHNLSVVYKHYISKTDSYLSIGYIYNSGRPYINPNINKNIVINTKPYHSLNFSLFHFTQIFGKFTMLFVQVSNVLGEKHVFGYRFAKYPDINGIYVSEEMVPVSKRFFMVGVHLSFTGKPDI